MIRPFLSSMLLHLCFVSKLRLKIHLTRIPTVQVAIDTIAKLELRVFLQRDANVFGTGIVHGNSLVML